MPRNRRFATVEKSYITDIERERCKKVAAAYAELYELESILVLDVGRYGFVKLQYYTPEYFLRWSLALLSRLECSGGLSRQPYRLPLLPLLSLLKNCLSQP